MKEITIGVRWVMKRYAVLILVLVALASCAHVLSKEYVMSATTGVSFRQILDNTDAFKGKSFILGGTIIDTKNTKEGSEIEVLQNPIDKYGYITDPDITEGRYFIVTPNHLDPIIYKKGRSITFAGKLVGSRKEAVGEMEFHYPVFEAEQIYLWKEYKAYPYPYPYYDPFYYPYPYYYYSPFWYRAYYW